MISIHKLDKRPVSKTVGEHVSSIVALFGLAALVVTILISSNGISPALAADKEFDIDVDIDEDPIKRGDTQDITVTVRNDDTNNRVSDADVKLTVYPPDSDSTSATDETNDDGEAKFKVKIDDDAETGEYDVKIRVSKRGYDSDTVYTLFDVVRNHDHDDDDDDDDGNGSAAAASAASGSSASSAASSGSSSAASAASGNSAAAAAASPWGSASSAASGSSAASSAASGESSPSVSVAAN